MSTESLNIIFMGTPDFSVPALQKLIKSNHNVIAVYTQPPRPKGRGHQVQKSPVHVCAEEHDIPVYHPLNFKSDEAKEEFKTLKADIAVVAAYGLILPQAILDAPHYGCLNIHASLLPRWRGASPIQHAIWKGDKESGVTIMQMEKGLDTGPMILKEHTEITSSTTASELHDALSQMGGDMILKVLNQLSEKGILNAQEQDNSLSTYAPMLQKSDGEIDFSNPAKDIDQQIRALNPWPGTYMNGLKGRVKVLKAHIENNELVFDLVQPEGKKPMDFISAVNGGYLEK